MMQKTENILLRRMTFEDAPKIFEIEKECFSEPWSEKALKDSLANRNSYFTVSEINGEIIGYAGMYFALGEGYMYNIAVKSDFRNLGVGRRIIENMIGFCKEKKLEFLSLEVRKSNYKAIKLYKNMDFCEVGMRRNFYRNPQEDALIMTKYF